MALVNSQVVNHQNLNAAAETTPAEKTVQKNTLRIYAVGGTGINIAHPFLEKGYQLENIPGIANIDAVSIDTSRSNLLPTTDLSRFHQIAKVDGGGKNRAENYKAISNEINPILNKFPAQTMNLVIFSAGGASGSTTGPLLAKALAEANEMVACIVIINQDSLIETTNSRKTIASIHQMAQNANIPLVCKVINEKRRPIADKQALETIKQLSILCSNENLELDNTDLKNFFNFTKVTSAPASIAELNIYQGEENQKFVEDADVVTVAELLKSPEETSGILKSEYTCVGYPRHIASFSNTYFVIGVETINDLIDNLIEQENQFKKIASARTQVDVNRGLEADNTGMIL